MKVTPIILPNTYYANTFLVEGEGGSALIDCAGEFVFDYLDRLGKTPDAVLLTHGHFDHVGGCGIAQARGIKIYCGSAEKDLIFSEENRSIFGGVHIPDFKIYGVLEDGDELDFGGLKIKIMASSGHTAGGIVFLIDNCLFTGDTLFRGSIGRCDLPTGDFAALRYSLKKLAALDGDYTVYCGHGESTTLSRERRENPYLR